MATVKFAEILKDLMELEGISAYGLYLATGLEFKSIQNWLNGKNYPRYDALIKLAVFFGVSTDYLLGLLTTDRECRLKDSTQIDINKIQSNFIVKVNLFLQAQGWSRYKLAKAVKIGQTTLTRWFNNNSMPETTILIRLSVVMCKSIDYLLSME